MKQLEVSVGAKVAADIQSDIQSDIPADLPADVLDTHRRMCRRTHQSRVQQMPMGFSLVSVTVVNTFIPPLTFKHLLLDYLTECSSTAPDRVAIPRPSARVSSVP